MVFLSVYEYALSPGPSRLPERQALWGDTVSYPTEASFGNGQMLESVILGLVGPQSPIQALLCTGDNGWSVTRVALLPEGSVALWTW